jgi:hypothetical protein
MGSAGFEPAASSAQGWHHTKLDNDPITFDVTVSSEDIILSLFGQGQYLYIESGHIGSNGFS